MNAIGDIYAIYNIYKAINHIKTHPDEPVSRETCQNIRDQIIAGGCIYIKFAQWMVSKLRSDSGHGIATLVANLDTLFDQCPYHDIEHTRALFRQSFADRELDSQVTDLELIASGSVGQVYRAVLNKPYVVCTRCDAMVTTRLLPNTSGSEVKSIITCQCPPEHMDTDNDYNKSDGQLDNDNRDDDVSSEKVTNGVPDFTLDVGQPKYVKVIRKVAIKIKHPGIDEQIADKMRVFQFMAKLQKVRWIKNWLSLHVDFQDFMDNLVRQSDFREELHNNRRLRHNFRDNHLVYFPLALTASRDVLISEYVSGQSIDNIGEYHQMKCCLNYASMVAQMVLIDNFCHADLHRGNWCISLGPIDRDTWNRVDASTVHLPRDLDSYLEHDPSKENAILHIKSDLRHNGRHTPTPPTRSPTDNSNGYSNGSSMDGPGDYAIIVFDTGICFSNTDINVNRKIWEAFERSSLDYLLEIVDYIVVGDYDESIKEHVKEFLTMFRDDFNGVLPMFDKLNEVLAIYNCRLTTIALNITVLFALINETLARHNLVGSRTSGKCHNDMVRAKMLDLICYGKSRGIYQDLVAYLRNKEDIRHNDLVELDQQHQPESSTTNKLDADTSAGHSPSTSSSHSDVALFGKACNSTLIFGNPDDLLAGLSDSDDSDDDSDDCRIDNNGDNNVSRCGDDASSDRSLTPTNNI